MTHVRVHPLVRMACSVRACAVTKQQELDLLSLIHHGFSAKLLTDLR